LASCLDILFGNDGYGGWLCMQSWLALLDMMAMLADSLLWLCWISGHAVYNEWMAMVISMLWWLSRYVRYAGLLAGFAGYVPWRDIIPLLSD
jgi:hypothetical protein